MLSNERSTERMIEHVGATKEEFTAQIKRAGFVLAEDLTLRNMKENFMYSFVEASAE